MAYKFTKKQELEKHLINKIIDSMDEVYDKLLEKLLSIIKKDVYSVYQPKFYERTEDLLNKDNWEIKRNKGRKYIIYELYFKEEKFTYYTENADREDPSGYIHGNYMYGAFDSNAFLKMLNGKTKYGDNPFNFPEIYRKPFWDDFIYYCNRYYPILLKNACKRNGVNLN